MRPNDLEQLTDDLRNYCADLEVPGTRAELLETTLPRILATLELIPDSARQGDFLELGATPFFLTLCLQRLCSGRICLGNWFGPTTETRGTQRLTHSVTGHEIHLEFDLFNVETDTFPHPDESFDVVIFSELIEHLGVNPVRTLAEIHRVLRPGGFMILTTPNALGLERLGTYLRGGSQMVDRYSPLFGYGARHNREYQPQDLRELVSSCGFVIDEMVVRDLIPPHGTLDRLRRDLWRRFLSLYSPESRHEHMFMRARRGTRFRWNFPARLFDNTEFYILVRYPWVEMGINDSIQCGEGWYKLEEHDGKQVRRIRGVGQGFLKADTDRSSFGIELYAPPATKALEAQIIVWDRWLGRPKLENVYLDQTLRLEAGRWQSFELPLQRFPRVGDEIEVRIAINRDARANPPVDDPESSERGVAVHRFWFRTP